MSWFDTEVKVRKSLKEINEDKEIIDLMIDKDRSEELIQNGIN